MEVYKAIAAVAGELAAIGIGKNSENKQQGFKFRGIDAVYNALAPLLAKHHLVILPRCVERSVVERHTKSGGVIFSVAVKSEFDMVSAIDGTKHTIATYGEAMDSGDKATNKALSAAYKYAAFQAFCIPTEETAVDADSETHSIRVTQQVPVDLTPWLMMMDKASNAKELKAATEAAWAATQDDRITAHFDEIVAAKKAAAKKPSEEPTHES